MCKFLITLAYSTAPMKYIVFLGLSIAFFNTTAIVSGGPLSSDSSSKTPNKRHHPWVDCFIVSIKGDTVYAQIKDKKDYSAEGSLQAGSQILLRLKDGSETKLSIGAFRELDILKVASNAAKYLSLKMDNQFKLYRVISDGLCKLLYSETVGDAGQMAVTPAHSTQNYGTAMKPGAAEYFLYYNSKLTLVHLDDDLNLSPISKDDCYEVFQNCPLLAEKMQVKKSKLPKLDEMVSEFNACLAK